MSLLAQVGGALQRWDPRFLGRNQRGQLAALFATKQEPALHAALERCGTAADSPLAERVRRAWEVGKTIDLSGVSYEPVGPAGSKVAKEPSSYYFFLAGLVSSLKFRRVLEIGTHFGGSSAAMLRAMEPAPNAKLVTIDIRDNKSTAADVVSLIGDANSEAMVEKVVVAFGGEPIDFLFIDADHRYRPSLTNLGLYAALLRPRYVALDDIVLNHSMRALWKTLRVAYQSQAINCVELEPAIRPQSCGFGLIALRP